MEEKTPQANVPDAPSSWETTWQMDHLDVALLGVLLRPAGDAGAVWNASVRGYREVSL